MAPAKKRRSGSALMDDFPETYSHEMPGAWPEHTAAKRRRKEAGENTVT